MSKSSNRNYLPEIDQLRAIAALTVVFYHGIFVLSPISVSILGPDAENNWYHSWNPLVTYLIEGHSAVGLFLVLSGFILSIGAIDNNIRYGAFLKARAWRIYPMLILCVMAAAAAEFKKYTLLDWLAAVLPVTGAKSLASPMNTVSWSVGVEFACYFLFPFLILFSNREGNSFLLKVVCAVLMVRGLTAAASGNVRDISYWSFIGRLDQFCIGIIVARIYRTSAGWPPISRTWAFGAWVVVMVALWSFNHAGGWPSRAGWKVVWPTIEGGMWAGVVLFWVMARPLSSGYLARALAWIGEISYSIYLLHFSVLTALAHHQLVLTVSSHNVLNALVTTLIVAVPVVLIVSAITYEVVERPFFAFRSRYIEKPGTV